MKVRNRVSKAPRIEMLPLIDVVFLLLVFFIYAMLSMAVHRGLSLDLPESTEATTSKESQVLLSIRTGVSGLELFLDKTPVLLTELGRHLALTVDNADDPQLLLFAEEHISYQQLYQVLDELKKSGIKDISLQASSE
ncbi:MAG: biopolymer transporter ExbD [Desulfocapsa sp.]|nr:biopolymer transporter ExbD [Desulfocapsa sp.]